jgi:hypothetical protein
MDSETTRSRAEDLLSKLHREFNAKDFAEWQDLYFNIRDDMKTFSVTFHMPKNIYDRAWRDLDRQNEVTGKDKTFPAYIYSLVKDNIDEPIFDIFDVGEMVQLVGSQKQGLIVCKLADQYYDLFVYNTPNSGKLCKLHAADLTKK